MNSDLMTVLAGERQQSLRRTAAHVRWSRRRTRPGTPATRAAGRNRRPSAD